MLCSPVAPIVRERAERSYSKFRHLRLVRSGTRSHHGISFQESAMHAVSRYLAAGLFAVASASAVHAQTRSVQAVPNPQPSAAQRAAQSAPAPAGLRPVFPAGITSGSGAAVSRDPIAASTSPIAPFGSADTTGAATGTPQTGTTIVPELPTFGSVNTTVLGAGAVGAGNTVRGPGQRVTGGAGGFSAVDQARSFFFADANHDGELTRAEAGRLSIATMAFEEMDRNFDGIISRFEYEDSLR
jgi:hypothetical protein